MKSKEIKLKFGKYKGTALKDVPVDYLNWAVNNTGLIKGKALDFAKEKLNFPKERYKVIVKNSVNSDGQYVIEAYNAKEAIEKCQKNNKIQCTQSFQGTEFSVIEL